MSQICNRLRDRVQLQPPTALRRIQILYKLQRAGGVNCGISDGEFELKNYLSLN